MGRGNATTLSPTRGGGWLPIAISLVALAISMSNLYVTQLAPFSPLITIGNVVWHPANAPLPAGQGVAGAAGPQSPKPVTKAIALLVPLTITHAGGQPGVLEDLVVRLSRLDGAGEWIFAPEVFVDERAYFTTFGPADHLKWIIAPFYPIAVARGAQVERFLFMISVESPRFSGGPLAAGRYSIRVLARISGRPDYTDVDTREETLTAQFVSGLLQGDRWSTTPAELTAARQRVK